MVILSVVMERCEEGRARNLILLIDLLLAARAGLFVLRHSRGHPKWRTYDVRALTREAL